MPKRIPAVTQAFIDLLTIQTELQLARAHGDVKKERAAELAAKMQAATEVLQRTVNHVQRVLEHGVGEES